MNVKTLKRLTRRSLSMLLSVLMVLSLFTVCMVGGTLSASAYSVSGATIYFDNSNTNWSNVYLYIGNGSYLTRFDLTQITGTNMWKTTVSWKDYDNYFFSSDTSYSSGSVYTAFNGISDSNKTEQISAAINSNTIVTAESGSPYKVTFSTTNTISSLDGYVYFNKPDGWDNVYLYIGRDNNAYTAKYSLTLVSGNLYKVNVSGWADTTEGIREAFYFSENSLESSSTAITTRYNGDSGDKTKLYYCAFTDIATDNVYTPVGSSSPYELSLSPYTSSDTFWVDATLYNYRNKNQITANSDYADAQADEPFNFSVFGDYNTAVTDWYRKAYATDGTATDKNTTATPLYQGNFRENTKFIQGDVSNTIGYVKPGGTFADIFYWFVSVANGANRYGGHATGYGTQAAAINLVDKQLNANGTITQNGVELPQFSDAFMETYNGKTVTGINAIPTGDSGGNYTGVETTNKTKTFGEIQTKYENLKFQFKTTTTTAGNKKYSYQANDGSGNSVDGNRYYDAATKTIRKGEAVYGCANEKGYATANPGYFPFNKTNPTDKSMVVNSFGTRFDIEFTMPSADSGDGYQLQGTTGNYEDLTFNFEGDDDVWVYIDGYLALDVGGSHNNAKGYINLSKFKSKIESGYYDATSTNTKSNQYSAGWAYTDASNAVEEDLLDDLIKSLQDTNKTHKITVFYMERGMFDSNFKMEFMLPQSNKLIVNEDVDDSAVNAGLKTKTMEVANKDAFDVQVKTDSTSTPKTNTVKLPLTTDFTRTSPDGTTTTTLQNKGTGSGTVTNKTTTSGNLVGVDAYYSWIDNSGNSSGSGIGSPNNGSMYLLYDQSGTFYDQFALGCNMSVVQSDTLKKFGTTYNSSTGLLDTTTSDRTVSKYYDTSYTVKDVYDKDITVTESSSGTGGQFIYHNSNLENENQVRLTVDYVNKIKTGDITFTKINDDSGKDKDDEYTFKIEICNLFGDTTDTSWTPASGLVGTNVTTSTDVDLDSEGKFGIKKGQTVTFKGIPVGTSYKITEVIGSNDNYGISKITSSSSTSFTNEGNGFVVNDKTTTDDAFTVTNTYDTTDVVFRFYDRKIVDGQPTGMEDHYTYFTRKIPGNLLTSDKTAMEADAAKKVVNYSPTIKNVFKNYTLAESNIVYDTLTLSGNEEGTGNLTNGNKYIIATYVPEDRLYTSQFTYYNEDGTGTSKTVTKAYNQLIDIDNDKVLAPPVIKDTSSNDSDAKKTFLYWAKEVDVYTGDNSVNTYWTPVTTNYYYSYRVVDDGNYLAVYTGDVVNGKTATKQDADVLAGPYEKLSKTISVPKTDENGNIIKDESGNPVLVDVNIAYQPDYNGYAASTNERIYDSYSIDQSIGGADITKIDRTRVNVMFGSVGSPDTDTNITNVGYILFRNDGSYADTNQISSALLNAAASYANSQNTGDKKDDSITKSSFQYAANASVNGSETPYRLMVTDYKVNNVMTNDNYTDDVGDYGGYTGKENQVNLTNKNRLNIVFDIINNENTQKAYYTCYTYMYRGGSLYISPTPATFNLKDAPPMFKDPDAGKTTYPVEITSVGIDGKATSLGTVTSNFTTVTDGKKITLTVKIAQVGDLVGELKKLEIGNKSVDVTSIALGGTYVYTFSTADISGSDTSLKIKATFDGVAANGISVNVPTVENCSITTNPAGNFIEYNNSITVTVTPASGYAVKETNGFTVNATTGVATKTITVTEDMTADDLTAAMKPEIMETPYKLTVKANTGGSVTVTTTDGTTSVTAGNEKVIYIDKASPEVTLSATADTNYEFAGWAGAATGNTVSTKITVSSDTSVTANFTKVNSTFKVNVSNTTYGKIDSVKLDGTDLTADSNGYYTAPVGATVTISASALGSGSFSGWTGGTVTASNNETTTFIVSAIDGIVYTANFMTERTVYFAFIDQEKHKGTSEAYDKSYPKDTVNGISGSGEGYWSSIYADFGNNDSAGDLNTMTYEGVWSYNDHLATVYSLTFTNEEEYIQFRASSSNNSYDRTAPTTIVDNAVYFANGDNGGRTSTKNVDKSQWTVKGDNNTKLNDFIGTTIYFTNNLNSSGDRWAIYYYNDAGATGWVNMTNIGGNQYKTDSPIPDDCDKFIVCRMNGSATGNNWDNCWNQSYELNVSTGNYVTTTGWVNNTVYFNVSQSNS